MKGCFSLIITVLCLLSVFIEVTAQVYPPVHVVIDPGHGGKDPGKPGDKNNKLHEKDINLSIALKLGGYIQQKLKGVKVTYTRTRDNFVSLEQRTEMANKLNADYFISIHCNSNPNKWISGAKLHIHSHSDTQSKVWAKTIEKDLVTRAQRKSRGIMSAYDRGYNLYVLQNTKMPAILAELGFLTNPTDSRYLSSEQGRVFLASSLFRSFRDFISDKQTAGLYKVQIMASQKKVSLQNKGFKKLGMKVEELRVGTNRKTSNNKFIYKYMVGTEPTKDAAYQLASKVKKLGFKDAFVVKLR